MGSIPHSQHGRPGCLFFVRHLIQNWSGMGGPTSSFIATIIVFAGVHKYPNEAKYAFDKMEIPLRVQAQISAINPLCYYMLLLQH